MSSDRSVPGSWGSRSFRRRVSLLTAALVGLVASFALLSPAAAEVEASAFEVVMADPASIAFSTVVSGDPITDARLHYQRLNPEGNIGGSVSAEVPSSGTGPLSVQLNTNSNTTYIPVGTRFAYYWTFQTEDGDSVQTDTEEFVFLDGRFAWQTLEEGDVRVYWYADQALAQSVMSASASTVSEMSDLLDVEIDFPISVVLYAGTQDGLAAQRPRGGIYDEMSRTGGTRVAPDLVHVYDSLGLAWEDITRHEITHVITAAAGDGAFTSIPSWLDEGLATYAQSQKGGRAAAVEVAIQTDSALRLRNLQAPTNRAELIELFYGQSWSTVEYLIDSYGEDSIAQLLATVKEGNTTDQALEEVYGFDQDGLYNEWRVANGLPAIEFAALPDATSIVPDATRAPLTLPTSVAGGSSEGGDGAAGTTGSTDTEADPVVDPAGDGDGGNSNVMVAIAIGAVTLILAGGLGFVGLRMLRAK